VGISEALGAHASLDPTGMPVVGEGSTAGAVKFVP